MEKEKVIAHQPDSLDILRWSWDSRNFFDKVKLRSFCRIKQGNVNLVFPLSNWYGRCLFLSSRKSLESFANIISRVYRRNVWQYKNVVTICSTIWYYLEPSVMILSTVAAQKIEAIRVLIVELIFLKFPLLKVFRINVTLNNEISHSWRLKIEPLLFKISSIFILQNEILLRRIQRDYF